MQLAQKRHRGKWQKAAHSRQRQRGDQPLPLRGLSSRSEETSRGKLLSQVLCPVLSANFVQSKPLELPVDGEVPCWLRGSIVRNGAGFYAPEAQHMFDGYGMLVKFTFDSGKVSTMQRYSFTPALGIRPVDCGATSCPVCVQVCRVHCIQRVRSYGKNAVLRVWNGCAGCKRHLEHHQEHTQAGTRQDLPSAACKSF